MIICEHLVLYRFIHIRLSVVSVYITKFVLKCLAGGLYSKFLLNFFLSMFDYDVGSCFVVHNGLKKCNADRIYSSKMGCNQRLDVGNEDKRGPVRACWIV